MAIHPDFPESPYAILDPSIRWFPAPESSREGTVLTGDEARFSPGILALPGHQLRHVRQRRLPVWRADTW